MRLMNSKTYEIKFRAKIEEEKEEEDKKRRESEKDSKLLDGEKVNKVQYAILSHKWSESEFSFKDYESYWIQDHENDYSTRLSRREEFTKELDDYQGINKTTKSGLAKIAWTCAIARKHNIPYVWIDTCCIDKRDQVELSAAINSMYRWYRDATRCYAYLFDYKDGDRKPFGKSIWFTRGWTLQELVAPKIVEFYDTNWKFIGTKSNKHNEIANTTGIASEVLIEPHRIKSATIGQRMSWCSTRKVTTPEDIAYCLLGIFDVNMPLLYGEGQQRAFHRLQEEIIRYSDDHSIFAWKRQLDGKSRISIFADSPDYFRHSANYSRRPDHGNLQPYHLTNKGLSIAFRLLKVRDPDKINDKECSEIEKWDFIASLDCSIDANSVLGIYLKCSDEEAGQFYRVKQDKLCLINTNNRDLVQRIFIRHRRI